MAGIPNSPFKPTGSLPGGGPAPIGQTPAFQQQQQRLNIQNQLTSQFGLGDIFSVGGDVWGWIKDHAGNLVPKDANGNIDWGKIGANVKDLGKWILDHKKDILDGLSVVDQVQRQKKSDEYAKQALEMKQQRWDAQEPLRTAGMAGMLDPSKNTPDISGLKAMANRAPMQAPLPVASSSTNLQNAQKLATSGSGNPFAQALPVASRSAAPTMPQPSAPATPLPVAPRAPGMPSVPADGPLTPRTPNAGGTIGLPPGRGKLPMPGAVSPLPVAGDESFSFRF